MNKAKKALKVTCVILGGLITLVIVLNIIFNIMFGIQLRNKIAELKAEGKPMTIAEIVPPPVPDEDNAALICKTVLTLLQVEEGKQINKIVRELESFSDISKWTDEQKQQISQIVNSRDTQYVYELIEEASRKPKSNFNYNYGEGPNLLAPELTYMRTAVRLICAKALLEADSGKVSEAFDTLLGGLKFSNHLKDEPLLISQLIRIACDNIIMDCIKSIADSKEIPAEETNSIMDELYIHQNIEPFIKSMDGERVAFGMWVFERILQGKTKDLEALTFGACSPPAPLAMLISFLGKPVFEKDFVCYLTLISKAQDSYNIPYYNKVNGQNEVIPKYCILSNKLLPAIGRIREKVAAYQANIDVCRIGLALKIYKAKNGTYPEKLENLVPEFLSEVPIDPFSGKSLKYSSYGNSFKLYSIGPNMRDDFGTPKAKESSAYNDYDIVWESRS